MAQEKRPHPLTSQEVTDARAIYGRNILTEKKRTSFWRRFVGNLRDPVIRILMGALVINLLFVWQGGDLFETLGIALAVLLATLISTLSEQGSEAAFARLSAASEQVTAKVRRVGEDGAVVLQELPISEIVVGDMLPLSAGEAVPADGILLAGTLTVDEASMTGESREVKKIPLRQGLPLPQEPAPGNGPSLFRGCMLVGGSGEMVVTRVGDATFLGRISGEVQSETRESPLKVRLGRLAHQISRLGYVAAALAAAVSLIFACITDSGYDGATLLALLSDWRYVWEQVFHALTLGLTVLVVAVPEGLPMMIAVVLSANTGRMVRDHVLVRKPVGIEAAGSLNILFTDKTGTLTEGRMSIARIRTGDGHSYPDMEALRKKAPSLHRALADACLTNTSAMPGVASMSPMREGIGGRRERKGRGETVVAPVTHLSALGGNATDRALMDAVLPARGAHPPMASPVLFSIPFDSTRKSSCAIARRDGREVLYVKGAPDRLIPRITAVYRIDGTRAPADRAMLTREVVAMAEGGGRILLLAEAADGEGGHTLPTRERLSAGDYGPLTLVALIRLSDRVRKEAPETVTRLRGAGIRVVMMTGDSRETATAIAESCGILGRGVDTVLDSRELATLDDDTVRALLPRLGVIARALPTDKSRLVRLSQAEGLVVGMTGDGINDAPALRHADVGFAMGAGTQVAKDAGDIIILDNNLASIARAVLYGRTVFKSIRKFITLQLTMNLCAMGVTMIAPFLGVEAPVTVVQMLWINLIMDTLGGLAFAGEAPLPSYMEEPPKRREESILNRYMVEEILYLGGFTIALCLLFLKLPALTAHFRPAEGDIYRLTAFFALFIFASVFNCFNCRTDRLKLTAGLSRNPAFLGIMVAVLAVQLLFVYLGGSVLRTAPLTVRELAITSLCALTVFPATLARRVWRRLSGNGNGY